MFFKKRLMLFNILNYLNYFLIFLNYLNTQKKLSLLNIIYIVKNSIKYFYYNYNIIFNFLNLILISYFQQILLISKTNY